MGVPSNAAIATLQVSKGVYDKDPLLQWICHLASPFQLDVNVQASKTPLLQLQLHNDAATTLSQRNAILRALCGMGLHQALDQAPYYLLGAGSPLVAGGLVQYMSLADSVKNAPQENDTVFTELEQTLEKQSFLLPSAQPTLADFDVALALPEYDSAAFPNLARWRATVLWSFQATAPPHIAGVTASSASPTLPAPIFYDGTEDMEAILAPQAAAPAKKGKPEPAKAKQAASNKNQKQEQQQQQQQQQQAKSKKEKSAKQPKAGGGNQAPDTYDISALDIRVGKIVKAWHHEEAEKLFCEEIDLGTETRQIASGLRPFYQTADLENRHVLVLCNLKARNLVGFPSHGMVLCASNADHTAVEFVAPPEGVALGERVTFDGITMQDPQPENKVAKKKIFEKLAPDLKTNADGTVVWKTAVAQTSKGPVRAVNGMANASVS